MHADVIKQELGASASRLSAGCGRASTAAQAEAALTPVMGRMSGRSDGVQAEGPPAGHAGAAHARAARGAVAGLRRLRARPLHRVRQRLERHARAREYASTRDRHPDVGRCEPRPCAPSVAHRRPADRRPRGRRRARHREPRPSHGLDGVLPATLPAAAGAVARAVPLDFDYRVFLFTFAVAGATTVMFALLPALHATRLPLTTALRGELGHGVRGSTLRSVLVVGQVAVSLMLLVAAATLLRNGRVAASTDLGLETAGVVSVRQLASRGSNLIPRTAEVLAAEPASGQRGGDEPESSTGRPPETVARSVRLGPPRRRRPTCTCRPSTSRRCASRSCAAVDSARTKRVRKRRSPSSANRRRGCSGLERIRSAGRSPCGRSRK